MREGLSKSYFHGALTKDIIFDIAIALSALVALVATAYYFSVGIFIIVPHLFYVPIILVAYRHPERAIALVGLLAAGYLAEVLFFAPIGGIEIINALLRIAIYFIVAIVISNLAGRLRARESRYRGIFETSGAGIFLFSPRTGQVTEMNRGCSEMLGYQKDEALSLLVPAIWPGYPGHTGTIDGNGIEGLDCNLIARNGTPRSVLLSASFLPDQEVVCTVVTATAELKQVESQLRRSEETLRVILNTTDVGILLIGPGKKIVEANAAAVRLFGGAGREDLVGQSQGNLIAERDREAVETCQKQVLNGEAPVSGEFTFCRLDGAEWPAEVSFTHLVQDGEAPERLVISIRDITERRLAERDMREENRRLFVINEVMAAAGASHNLDDLLGASLAKSMALLNLDLGAVHLMRPGSDIAHLRARVGEGSVPSSVNCDEVPYRYVLVDGEARFIDRFHERYPGYDGPPIRSFVAVPIPGDDGPVGCITAASRTKDTIPESERLTLTAIGESLGNAVVKGMLQEDLEAALASANRYLEKANAATEAANLYVDILTHDINNANAAAMGYLQMFLESPDVLSRESLKKPLAAIYQSSEIIRNVTTIRRLESENYELRPVRLEPVLREMRNYYAGTRISCEGSDVMVLADDLIGEVFSNLIGNAAKFGGPDVEVTINVRENGDTVSVTVADTGPGIPDDLKPRVFERKERGKTTKSGKGLGLYIVRNLVERYGGSIRAGDRIPGRPEEGAAMTVSLRRYDPEEA